MPDTVGASASLSCRKVLASSLTGHLVGRYNCFSTLKERMSPLVSEGIDLSAHSLRSWRK